MPDSYKDLTHSAAEIDAAVGKADTAVQPSDIGTAAAQDVEYFATAAQGAKADTAVQPTDLGTAALADTTDFATSSQGAKADTAVQPSDIGTAAAQDVEYFATAAQGAKADTAVQPTDLGTAALADTTDFATSSQGAKADTAVQPGDLGTAASADSTDFATSSQGAKADTAVQPSDIGTAAAQDVEYFATAAQGAKADTAVQPSDIGTAAAQDVEYFATAAQGAKADTAVQPSDIGTAAAQDVEYFATAAQGAKADTAVQPGDLGTAATAAATDFATAAQGGKADSAIQGLKVNSSTVTPDSNKILSITIPTSAYDVNALPNTTKYAAAIDVSINSSTYVMTVQLKDQNGDNIGSSDSIDLPLETMVVGGSYDSANKKVILTLKNGETVEFSVADLVSGLQTELSASNKLDPAYINYDSTHRAVSDTEKTTWNGKQDALTFNGTYNASTNPAATVATAKTVMDANGGKNKLQTPDTSDLSGTLTSNATINSDGSISIVVDYTLSADGGINYMATIPAGTYHYSAIEGSSTAETNAYDSYIQKQVGGSWTTIIRDNSTNPGNVATFEAGEYRVTLRLRKSLPAGTYTFKPMLCTAAEYAISPDYQPYSKTNVELTNDESEDRAALVEVVDSGAKNVLRVDEIGVSGTHGQTYTTNGVTFTLNSDGSVTATRNETSTSNADCNLRFNGNNFYVDDFCNGKYVLSGCPAGGSSSTYFIRANRNTYSVPDYGEGVLLEQTSEQNIYVTMRVTMDFTGTVTFKPMICTKAAWDISHTYQPYRPSYQELYDMVKALQT